MHIMYHNVQQCNTLYNDYADDDEDDDIVMLTSNERNQQEQDDLEFARRLQVCMATWLFKLCMLV